ncbi:MAG: TIR domain-containing protein [Alphaproteobacteria bacterium]|jgi:hypothetical protein|nr:TIR domain-containing protein [Alphaproteobacteria bacterium]
MSGGIFISYRREDAAGAAGRLHDHLSARFGREAVFMDVDAIEPGVDFHEVLNQQVGACDVLIAVIGRDWLDAVDEDGQQRIADCDDFVQIEIAAALARNVRVIPVLVEGARMPKSEELPGPLKALARRNAAEISHSRFVSDVHRLSDVISKFVRPAPSLTPQERPVQGDEAFTRRMQNALLAFQDNARIFVAPNLPEDREENARRRTATSGDEEVLALVDFTVMNNANDALLVTSLGLRIHHSTGDDPTTRFIANDEIRNAPISKTGWWKIAIGAREITVSGGPNRDLLVRFLQAVRDAA